MGIFSSDSSSNARKQLCNIIFLLNFISVFLPENTGALYQLKKDPNDKDETLEFKYIKKEQVTHDTFIFTFELPENMNLGLNLGQHVAIEYINT